MDPWTAIACVLLFSSCMLAILQRPTRNPIARPHRECPLGQGSQDRAVLILTWIPTGEFFQTVPPSWVRA